MTQAANSSERRAEAECVGLADDFALGALKPVEVDGRTVGIVRSARGLFAIGLRCPHQGAPMCASVVTGTMLASGRDEYIYGHDGEVVQCPWHGYEFHVDTGKSVGGVVRGRIPVYDVAVQDGRVFVSLRQKPAR